ncbi:hypothetical protein [Streptomyces guryensis]|uniref:Uncharacterized protein n=1 Tax=Streptomyces guryensis TaxID=2886947 RepID=A0A9Q3VKC6_9ACTN|nr:hypothetical protein [Streptomyces guryensis]MCD9873811.1 hypothetical protein [Streptomyces guryensis]
MEDDDPTKFIMIQFEGASDKEIADAVRGMRLEAQRIGPLLIMAFLDVPNDGDSE